MEDKKFWNWSSIFVYDFWHNIEYKSYRQIADQICENIKDDTKILEVACGTGILTNEITKRYDNLDYTALDYAENMLNICHSKKINAKFEMGDATNLNYPDNYFDIVIIANALHIAENPEKIVSEIKRCLKDDGLLYAPNFLAPHKFTERFLMSIIKKFGYNVHNGFDIDGYIAFLEANGLNVNKKEIYECFRSMLFTECCKEKQKTLTK